MHLTRFVLNPASRRVLRELSDPYEMHRTVLRGFPEAADGGPGRVLWRIDRPRRAPGVVLLVQSAKRPRWEDLLADLPSGYLLCEAADGLPNPAVKPFEPEFAVGEVFAFRLRANPTVNRDNKRHALLREEDQLGWLARKGEQAGFAPRSVRVVPEGTRRGRPRAARPLTFFATVFEGILEVRDPIRFAQALAEGIGSAKAFGFGLLSLARPQSCAT